MPRSSVLLTGVQVTGDMLTEAAASVWARTESSPPDQLLAQPLDNGAVLQVLLDGIAVVSILRPRPLPSAHEIARLLPNVTAPAGATSWTEAYTSWHPHGRLGMAILDEVAAIANGTAVHADLGIAELTERFAMEGIDLRAMLQAAREAQPD